MQLTRLMLVAVTLWGAGTAGAADSLVVKGADGEMAPGAATAWTSSGDRVVFTLAAGEDGAAWAQAVSESVAGVTAVFEGGKLTVTGLSPSTLLEQLSSLTFGGDADPLAELAGLADASPMEGPEGGGSIRASKPTAVAVGSGRGIQAHDTRARFEADVVAVERGAFPQVSLKVKMRKGGRANPLKKKLYYGKIVDAVVLFNVSDGVVDLGDEANRRNLAAWYLEKGDRIIIHPVAAGAGYEIDWLSRK